MAWKRSGKLRSWPGMKAVENEVEWRNIIDPKYKTSLDICLAMAIIRLLPVFIKEFTEKLMAIHNMQDKVNF